MFIIHKVAFLNFSTCMLQLANSLTENSQDSVFLSKNFNIHGGF